MKSIGYNTFKFGKLRIQVYYPKYRLFKDELYVSLDTCFRIVLNKEYIGFGFQVFGVGIGFDF